MSRLSQLVRADGDDIAEQGKARRQRRAPGLPPIGGTESLNLTGRARSEPVEPVGAPAEPSAGVAASVNLTGRARSEPVEPRSSAGVGEGRCDIQAIIGRSGGGRRQVEIRLPVDLETRINALDRELAGTTEQRLSRAKLADWAVSLIPDPPGAWGEPVEHAGAAVRWPVRLSDEMWLRLARARIDVGDPRGATTWLIVRGLDEAVGRVEAALADGE